MRPFGEDLPLVQSSVPERAISTVHRHRIERQALGECRYLLALMGHRPVGWVMLLTGRHDQSEWRTRFGCAEVEDLYVTASARGRGLGRELMLAAEAAARDVGLGSIGLATGGETDSAYLPARRL